MYLVMYLVQALGEVESVYPAKVVNNLINAATEENPTQMLNA